MFVFSLTDHQRSVFLWTAGIVAGLLGLLIEQRLGFGLIPVFLTGPLFIGWRYIRAVRCRASLRAEAQKRGLAWTEPDIRDGRLVWSNLDVGGMACVSIVGPPMTADQTDRLFGEERFKPAMPRLVSRIAPEAWERFKTTMTEWLKGQRDNVVPPPPPQPEPVDIDALIGQPLGVPNFTRSLMRTSSGTYYDYSAPVEEALSLPSLVMGCLQAPRFGGQYGVSDDDFLEAIERREHEWSVAHHSCLAGWVAWLIAPEDRFFIQECTAHDAHEGVYGDMPSPLKFMCPDYGRLERQGARLVRAKLHLPHEMTPRAKVVDGLCLAAESEMQRMAPAEWLAPLYIDKAKAMQIRERAEVLKMMRDVDIAHAMLDGLASGERFVEDWVRSLEEVYQAGRA